MNKYQDRWGRFHHKPCVNGEPSSNNGWIYTAYAKKIGLPINTEELSQCFQDCLVYYEAKDAYILNRNPEESTVPISRDEILGMVALGFIDGLPPLVTPNNWNFCPFIQPKFSLTKLVKQLWELRPSLRKYYFDQPWYIRMMDYIIPSFGLKHRNYFWQNNLDQLYRFAFSVPLQDRYFMLKCWDKFQWYNPAHIFYAAISAVDKLGQASGIRFLKYGGEKNKAAMVQEFPEDHPIRN